MLQLSEIAGVDAQRRNSFALKLRFRVPVGWPEKDAHMVRPTPSENPAGLKVKELGQPPVAANNGGAIDPAAQHAATPQIDALSLAREMTESISAILTNAEAALRWIGKEPANIVEVRNAIEHILDSSRRAGQAVKKIRYPDNS